MASINVQWNEKPIAFDMWNLIEDAHIDQQPKSGTLTDEHPRSSYGQPIIVARDGRVLLPSDMATYSAITTDYYYTPIAKAAREAGYNLPTN